MNIDLSSFEKTILSQWGQDGVLDKIFELIGTTNKYFVEFGSSGTDEGMGNTAYLRRSGFDGLLMDGSDKPYGQTVDNRKYDVKIEMVSAININHLFAKYSVPTEFDLLSIDIDGQDFHVWNAIEDKYKPRVVSIEVNFHINAGTDKVMPLNNSFIWGGNDQCGASITALKKLGNKKGYSLIAFPGSDLIFIRNDILETLKSQNVFFSNINNEYELEKLNKLNPRCYWLPWNQNNFTSEFWKSSDVFL
jgi:hypothetical protein